MTSRLKERDSCHVPLNTVSPLFERELGETWPGLSTNQALCHIAMNVTQNSKERDTGEVLFNVRSQSSIICVDTQDASPNELVCFRI